MCFPVYVHQQISNHLLFRVKHKSGLDKLEYIHWFSMAACQLSTQLACDIFHCAWFRHIKYGKTVKCGHMEKWVVTKVVKVT